VTVWLRRLLQLTRIVAGGIAVSRLAKAATAAEPVHPATTTHQSISVIIPARDEAERIGPVLAAMVGAPGVHEVLVVDDQSADATAAIARAAGATVVAGAPLRDGWAGKAWALQQGIEAATGDWVVTLDADTNPDRRLPTALVSRALSDQLELPTVGGRFDCPTAGSRWLHPAMLTTLVYRFGPPGIATAPDRAMANGQCMAFPRVSFLERGGMAAVSGEVVEDIALARAMAADGARVAFLDAGAMLEVRMFESLEDTWRGWGRSLALPGVEPRNRQLVDLVVVALAQALPLPRLLTGRADIIDAALLALRLGTLAGTRSAYSKPDAAYWLSPLADVPAVVAIAKGIARRGTQTWRGRTYA
jgi:dolichol-phosphate mannosyltransferase